MAAGSRDRSIRCSEVAEKTRTSVRVFSRLNFVDRGVISWLCVPSGGSCMQVLRTCDHHLPHAWAGGVPCAGPDLRQTRL